MVTEGTKLLLRITSIIVVAVGFSLLWFAGFWIFGTLGENLFGVSILLVLISFFLVPSWAMLRYAEGKESTELILEAAEGYIGLAIYILLAFGYDLVLPSSIPFFWRFFMLPLATILIVFSAFRKIPRTRRIIDKLIAQEG